MIYPPDELLADLQSVIPEASQDGRASAGSGKGQYDYLPELPGADEPRRRGEDREVFEVPPGYDPPALTPPPGGEVSVYYTYIVAYPFVLLPPFPPPLSLRKKMLILLLDMALATYLNKIRVEGGAGSPLPRPNPDGRTDPPTMIRLPCSGNRRARRRRMGVGAAAWRNWTICWKCWALRNKNRRVRREGGRVG